MKSCDFKVKDTPSSPLKRILQRNNERLHHKSHEVLKALDDEPVGKRDNALDRKDSAKKRNSRSEENLLGMCQAQPGPVFLTQDFFRKVRIKNNQKDSINIVYRGRSTINYAD